MIVCNPLKDSGAISTAAGRVVRRNFAFHEECMCHFFVFLRSAAVYKYQILLQVLNQSSNEVYFDAATVQQQPHLKRFACVTDMNRPSV